jgi:hypothetical protein
MVPKKPPKGIPHYSAEHNLVKDDSCILYSYLLLPTVSINAYLSRGLLPIVFSNNQKLSLVILSWMPKACHWDAN